MPFRKIPIELVMDGTAPESVAGDLRYRRGALQRINQGDVNMGRPSKFTEFTPAEPFARIRRTGDLLHCNVAGMHRLAKASLSRLLQQFEKKADFVIITSYHHTRTEQENAKSFQDFPCEYRALVGTMKIGAYKLAGHWQDQGGEDALERSWFVTNQDPNLSTEDFIAAAKTPASKYEQTAIIVSRQGVVTLETPAGEVWATLTTAGAIENVTLKWMQARRGLDEGKGPAIGYSELKRLRDKRCGSTFVLHTVPEEAKTSSLKPGIFVTVPVNNFSKWAFSTIGLNWPDWKILE
jgi:hypothetical protein